MLIAVALSSLDSWAGHEMWLELGNGAQGGSIYIYSLDSWAGHEMWIELDNGAQGGSIYI